MLYTSQEKTSSQCSMSELFMAFCGVASVAWLQFPKIFKNYCYLQQSNISHLFFSWKEEIKKDTQEPFWWACCFSHWLYFKGVSAVWAALIYGHVKWSLTSLFCFYVLCSCQPFQHSLLFWIWSSCGWKEVWFIWFQSFSNLLLCV